MAYIGLDVGTSGCKATLVDITGKIIAYTYKEYDLIFPGPGRVEIKGETVWNSVCFALQSLRNKISSKIDAISVGSFGEALVFLDEKDQVLDNSIVYSDIRGTEEIKEIIQKIDKAQLENLTGMPLNSMYSLNKLLWIMKNKPECYSKARKIMLFGDFITYKLTGEAKIDYSLCSRTMAFDIENKVWSEEIFKAFTIDSSKFSQPVPAGSIIGVVRKSVVETLGLNQGTVVVAGGHDQACAALGAGVLNIGDAVDGMGSAECISAVLDKNLTGSRLFENKFCCEPHVVKGKYITLAFNSTAGAVIKWYRETFEKKRADIYKENSANFYEVLDGECPIQPSQLLVLPHFAGSGTPYMDSYASGAILGLKLGTKKEEIYKAILEGICFEIKFNSEMLQQFGVEIKHIVAVGGGARSPVLLQIKSDIMGKTVKTLECPEAGTIGLAILSAVACGHYPDVSTAVENMVRVDKYYEPRQSHHEVYKEMYEEYRQIYPAIKAIRDSSAKL